MDNSFFAFRAQVAFAVIEASGPVRVKTTQAEREDQAMYAREARRLANQARLAREAAAQRRADALTSPAERTRIERDTKRRADRKAQKRAAKQNAAPRR